jgi:hypothetical protein
LRANWPLAQIGFVVTTSGILACPSPNRQSGREIFCEQNAKFLGNQESAQVYLNSKDGNQQLARSSSATSCRNNKVFRKQAEPQAPSKVSWSETEFRQLIGDATEGTLARFLDNKLNVMFWYRSPRNPQLIFGAQLDPARLRESLARCPPPWFGAAAATGNRPGRPGRRGQAGGPFRARLCRQLEKAVRRHRDRRNAAPLGGGRLSD